MASSFHDIKRLLENRLRHASRFGCSAFCFGLIPQGISDHLPIEAKLPLHKSHTEISLLSWNLLSDEHLYNNFMNISGIRLLEASINEKLKIHADMSYDSCTEINIYHGALYHLLAEFAQYLYARKSKHTTLTITQTLLEDFISIKHQPSRKARSRTPKIAALKARQVEKVRRLFIEILCDTNHPKADEYQMTIRHCMEIIYHIKGEDGALRWSNRFKNLRQNERAVKALVSSDILALQECSVPSKLEALVHEAHSLIKTNSCTLKPKYMQFLVHNVKECASSTDNVVIAFDATQFALVEEPGIDNPLKLNFEKKKPALYAKLVNLDTGEVFIIGSIHHPGGDIDCRHEIKEAVAYLQNAEKSIPYFIAGDYNHTAQQFSTLSSTASDKSNTLYYPKGNGGTMAGCDYGNQNQAIDAIMSNIDLENKVSVSPVLSVAKLAPPRISVQFKLKNKEKTHSGTTVSDGSSTSVTPTRLMPRTSRLHNLSKTHSTISSGNVVCLFNKAGHEIYRGPPMGAGYGALMP